MLEEFFCQDNETDFKLCRQNFCSVTLPFRSLRLEELAVFAKIPEEFRNDQSDLEDLGQLGSIEGHHRKHEQGMRFQGPLLGVCCLVRVRACEQLQAWRYRVHDHHLPPTLPFRPLYPLKMLRRGVIFPLRRARRWALRLQMHTLRGS